MLGNDTQAGRVLKKAGGAGRLSKLIQYHTGEAIHRSAIYRWNYPKDKGGTGGHIPSNSLTIVAKALRREGIFLSEQDLLPELYPEKK